MNKTIKYSKAEKLSNFNKPKYCPTCNKMMKPALHCIIMKETFFWSTQMAQLYNDKCEWCGYEFEYWA